MIGNTIERLLADAGYRGHHAPADYKFRVYTSGQKRRLTPQIKRELRRRAAIEPVIGHLKAEHRMGRNHLAYHAGDAANAVWPPPVITSICCSSCCLDCCQLKKQQSVFNASETRKLHGRLKIRDKAQREWSVLTRAMCNIGATNGLSPHAFLLVYRSITTVPTGRAWQERMKPSRASSELKASAQSCSTAPSSSMTLQVQH